MKGIRLYQLIFKIPLHVVCVYTYVSYWNYANEGFRDKINTIQTAEQLLKVFNKLV